MERLSSRLLSLRSGRLVREARSAISRRSDTSLTSQLVAWRHGFYAEHARLYDFDSFGFDDYVSDYHRATKLAKANDYTYLLDNKVLFSLYLQEIHTPTPVVYGTSDGRAHVSFSDTLRSSGLLGLLREKSKLVVKARDGSSGNRFFVLEHDGRRATINGADTDDVEDCLDEGRMLVTEFVHQHAYSRRIYPETTNTVRVLTLIDRDSGEPFVAGAVHRFGTARSRPVDNWAKGGLSAEIDPATGVLGPGVVNPAATAAQSAPLVWHDQHPETGEPLTGVVVPHWQRVLDEVLRTASLLPGSRYVGWDVVVTEEGPSIIEGNNRSGVNLFQVHRPLLVDARSRSFFRSHR